MVRQRIAYRAPPAGASGSAETRPAVPPVPPAKAKARAPAESREQTTAPPTEGATLGAVQEQPECAGAVLGLGVHVPVVSPSVPSSDGRGKKRQASVAAEREGSQPSRRRKKASRRSSPGPSSRALAGGEKRAMEVASGLVWPGCVLPAPGVLADNREYGELALHGAEFFASANALVTRYETALSKASEEAEAKYSAAAKSANAEAKQLRDEVKRLQGEIAAAKDDAVRQSEAEKEREQARKVAVAKKVQTAYNGGYKDAKAKYCDKPKGAMSEAGRLAEWIECDGMDRFYQFAQVKGNLDFLAEIEAGKYPDFAAEKSRLESFVVENASVEGEIDAAFQTIYGRLGHKCASQPPPAEGARRLEMEAKSLGVNEPSGSNVSRSLVEELLQERRAERLAGTPRAVILAATVDEEDAVRRVEALDEASDDEGAVASDVAAEATAAIVASSAELLVLGAGDETIGPEPVTSSAEVEETTSCAEVDGATQGTADVGEAGAEAEEQSGAEAEEQVGAEAETVLEDAVETEEGELVQV